MSHTIRYPVHSHYLDVIHKKPLKFLRILRLYRDLRLIALGPAGQLPERIGVVGGGGRQQRRGRVLHGGGKRDLEA